MHSAQPTATDSGRPDGGPYLRYEVCGSSDKYGRRGTEDEAFAVWRNPLVDGTDSTAADAAQHSSAQCAVTGQ